MNGRATTFDFGVRFTLADMCNNTSRFDMQQLDGLGFAARDPAHAVTFVENHDTDLNFPIKWNKILGYAYILTSEGYPMVYYKDYSTDAGCYGLKPLLNNLIWIHEKLANGSTVNRFKDFQCIVYERTGWPNLLVGLNNDQFNGWRTVTVQTGFGGNVHLHDYSGHSGDLWTDPWGNATIGIPPNDNGNGYVCYSRTGQDSGFAVPRLATTQVFEGAADLDIGPAVGGQTVMVGRIWCDAGTTVHLAAERATPGISFQLVDATGKTLNAPIKIKLKGWHTIFVTSNHQGESPFKLAVTYAAPRFL